MPSASTPAQYALILIDLVEERGHPREALLAGTSLADTGVEGIGARVSDSDFRTLAGNALTLTGAPDLGLDLGLRLHLGAHATLGQAFMTCLDLGQVLGLFLDYYHLLVPGLHLDSEIVDGRCVLTIHSNEEDDQMFMCEAMFAAFLNTLRALQGSERFTLLVEAPFPQPDHHPRYRDIFGERPRFNCVQARVSFDAAWLQATLPASNPALRALYENECARLLADLEGADSVAEQTLRLLRKLEGQYPQMPQVAEMLNYSARTYRRRLESERQSFQALLDKVRAEHATRYLQNTRLPLASIADLVGFTDTSNFRRAYLRWTGRAPGAVRRGV
jgi:AraC-like DNA-binding protein